MADAHLIATQTLFWWKLINSSLGCKNISLNRGSRKSSRNIGVLVTTAVSKNVYRRIEFFVLLSHHLDCCPNSGLYFDGMGVVESTQEPDGEDEEIPCGLPSSRSSSCASNDC